ncbi:adenosylcobinamide kinase /adenosylcobinamide-phosphate guanylyltransferase [Chitinophaga terrae (ex Kim and Jung 2007)]|jgi:adenosylcobinamide kinase/adenosylcobinamide-phosphate guanylyltransferase|uniref:Adenosylcobinamide kinase n=1 Tax=Chitinophaga terrae (ex Kim and Jung 2007) TaxID=408074 RepID=A0A1H3XYC6_9BACT|nr:bifunctional adenosylcobinamide kinase/adenosylcobinamide-phosphate guanylyltransferase [Chitinophaga terrae (ex Kim and Jung 2007)]MDQ0108120.1 adenosylcobinamide kinase/adenosylcobinamide-phosphate guanylyltransferase [Chitinophaga terrae (ex Kim and Jung 2007)]GEP89475.1 cobinamide kinase [Chitinophaga terrae (ex Kim and Jung 2007)]SEA04459.1 adenosylcobinamide kinase /adenosylcobinamide-phosphate guanylyltransferase [Chitinophaga terrae (ex Kim and Jung 2007)]
MVYLITGGARSGKSGHAQQLALQLSPQPVYVATARIWDDDFAERVRKHQADRGPAWTLFEEEQYISQLPLEGKTVVIDCITLWLTNFFVASNYDVNSTLNAIQEEINRLLKQPGTFIFVTNEIGMGVHAETAAGRQFTDLQGWVNQFIARIANTVILMVSGIPVVIKEEK